MLLNTTLSDSYYYQSYFFWKHCLSIHKFDKCANPNDAPTRHVNVQKLYKIDLVSAIDSINNTCK
jgi:hypothetical protein